MGLIRKALFAAVAVKAIQEVRKPENQRRIREFIDSRRGAPARHGR